VRFAAPKPKAVNERMLRGVVLKVDKFGNVVTNLTPQDAPALFQAATPRFKIMLGEQAISELKTAYAEGTPGQVFAIVGSMGYLELAANRASAADLLGAKKGMEVGLMLETPSAATQPGS
jgi:S-adenosylmethionine hydrolase